MRNPVRTEAEAFEFVIAALVLFAAVAVAGILGSGWIALLVFLVLAPVVFYRYFGSDPKVREPAVWDRHRSGPGDRKRILVVANETVAGRALRSEILQRAADADVDFLVVCPALNSRLKTYTSDEDPAREAAQKRLDVTLARLASVGIDARGLVGDGDPLVAVDDAVRTFGPKEIVISTHPPGKSNWLERGVVDSVRARYDVPVTHVVVDLAAGEED